MSALSQRISAFRDRINRTLLLINDGDLRDIINSAREILADAANGVSARDEVIRDLLQHSVSHYGHVADDTSGVGAAQALARDLIGGAS